MFIVAGLGNPDRKYFGTRHNAGFHAIDFIAQSQSVQVKKLKCKALIGEGRIGGEKVVLAKPQTYMNVSGESVYELLHFYKVGPENLIVLYDDVSLAPGRMRIREKGSAGGHNGIKSIIQLLGTDEFDRIKIGVGSPQQDGFDLADYVLGKFTKQEQKLLFQVFEQVDGAVSDIIQNGALHAMNRYNGLEIE